MLDKLNIHNQNLLLNFLVLFSRFEYALKRTAYYNKGKIVAEADWPRFIKAMKEKYDPVKSNELKMATDFLLKFPAREQVIEDNRLKFKTHNSTQEGPDICKLYNCIRITRNNLFHGGKFPLETIEDISRNEKLISSCIIVLKELLTLDKGVENMFWEKL